MAGKRMPAAERQREDTAGKPVPLQGGAVITGRIPDMVPGPKGS
jgi:hypothetical protein